MYGVYVYSDDRNTFDLMEYETFDDALRLIEYAQSLDGKVRDLVNTTSKNTYCIKRF